MSITGALSETPNDKMARMAYTSGDLIYLGIAQPGTASSEAKWRIREYSYTSGDVVSILFADGNLNFDNVWDDRASLSYS